MKCLKGICVHRIMDGIILIINYKWKFCYFDATGAFLSLK